MAANTTVGIFGGGQLGRMLAQAALPLGIKCVFLEDAADCPAAAMGKVYPTADFAAFSKAADVYTLEFENTPATLVTSINKSNKHCFPSEQVLTVAQDRLLEKQTFTELGIATVPFCKVTGIDELTQAVQTLGLPLVLKTSRGGYDGKGQFILKTEQDITTAWQKLGSAAPLIAEGFIHFQQEVSIIAVRGQTGEIKTYPLVENHHHEGILSHSIAPAAANENQQLVSQATQAVSQLLNHFNYVGVLALELFVTKEGVLANEIAPRVHNSGHWSIEGAVCSQFENHMRAVAGLPLGSTAITQPSIMLNIIGQYPSSSDVLAVAGTHLHLYGKSERPNRKIGHITLMPAPPIKEPNQDKEALAKVVEKLPNKMGML